MKSNRGEIVTIVLLILGLTGLGAYLFKPAFLNGESKRAKASKEASAHVETDTAALLAAERAKGSVAAAIVTEIGKANADAPAGPERDYIAKDVPLALDLLPNADLVALLAAEKRRAAVAEGKAEVIQKLYDAAYVDIQAVTKRATTAETKLDASFAARRQIDDKISEAAAVNLGLTRQRNQLIASVAVLFVLMVIYRLHLISPGSLGKMAADIHAGVNPITALDTYTAPWLQAAVRKAAKLNTELTSKPTS
jgi:hypothetical protein